MPADRRSWRRRLTAPAILIPLIAVAIALIWQDYDARRDYLVTTLELRSAEVTGRIETLIDGADAGLRAFVATYDAAALPAPAGTNGASVAADPRLIEILDAHPGLYHQAAIVDASGAVRASSGPFVAGARITAAARTGLHVEPDGLAVSDAIAPAAGGDASVVFSFPFPVARAGGVPLYLVMVMPAAVVTDALASGPDLPRSAVARAFDATGQVIAANSGADTARVGVDASDSTVWAEAAAHRTTPWFGRGLDGGERIVFFGYPPRTGWVTAVSFAQAELFAPLVRRVALVSAGLLLSVIGTLVLVEVADRRERRAWARLAETEQARARRALAREAQHHVRNALQVLRLRQGTETDPEVEAYVNEAMARIEWVLRDVLPSGPAGPLEPPDPEEPGAIEGGEAAGDVAG